MKKRLRTTALAAATLLIGVTTGWGQPTLRSSVIAAGGGRSSGSGTVVTGTIGQAVIGPTFGTPSALQGFWYTFAPLTPLSAPEEREVAGSILRATPNPFSAEATLHLDLPRGGRTVVTLHDALGREIRTLADGLYEAGPLAIRLDGALLPSGMYTARLVAGTIHQSIKVIVAK